MNGKMTAAVLYGKEDLKIEKVPIPRVGDGEVLVKVSVALTCGTDLKVYQRGYHARMIVPPALFGHELAGVIEEVGAGVNGFKKGMRVVALNSAPCQMCFYCSKHQENLCEDLLFNNGAYAEYIRVPRRIVEANMLVIPPNVSFEDAAMTEPLACVQGTTLNIKIAGCMVRKAAESDIAACNRVCEKVHGHDRGGELKDTASKGCATVVERDGRVTGYATTIGFFGHAVGETNDDLKALISAAKEFAGPGFLLPIRNTELFQWCLAQGLRVTQPMTLMSKGFYREPAGAFLPSILY